MGVSRKLLNWYARLAPARGVVPPPYKHVVQIGDPHLRRVSESVPLDKINTKEVQNVVSNLNSVMTAYGSVGMSAPQIGVNWRIFTMRLTAAQLKTAKTEVIKSRGMTEIPFTVFINPIMKVVNFHKVSYEEGCESFRGFAAEVPRFKEVEISDGQLAKCEHPGVSGHTARYKSCQGYNAVGEKISEKYKDWSARIAQHELDHLDAVLFTDVMDKKTLNCRCWEEVNLSQGKVVIPLYP